MSKRKIIILVLLVLLILMIVGFFVFKVDNKRVEENDNITLRLQWHIQTQFAGYYVALEKGFYNDVGLNVAIKEGGYGKNALTTVKAGIEEFGTKWTADLVAEGDEYISLANIVKDNGLVLISKKEKNITDVHDFKNKKVSIWFIGNEYQLFVLLDKYNISKNDLEILPQKWNMSQFLDDETDVAAAMTYNELLIVEKNGYPLSKLNVINFNELGVGFPGHNIFTSKEYFKKNKDICRRFVSASLKGWKYAIDNPEEAVNIVMKYDKEGILNKEHQQRQMKAIIDLIKSNQYKLGIHLENDYKLIESVFKEYGIIQDDVNIKTYFTNEFFN